MDNISARSAQRGCWHLLLVVGVGANLMLPGCARQMTIEPQVSEMDASFQANSATQGGHPSRWLKSSAAEVSKLTSVDEMVSRATPLQNLNDRPSPGELPAAIELHSTGELPETLEPAKNERRPLGDDGVFLPNDSDIGSVPPIESEGRLPELPAQLRADSMTAVDEQSQGLSPQFELLPASMERQRITLTRPDAAPPAPSDKFRAFSPQSERFSAAAPAAIKLSQYAEIENGLSLEEPSAVTRSTASSVETARPLPVEAFPIVEDPAEKFAEHAYRKLEAARLKAHMRPETVPATVEFLPTKGDGHSVNRLRASEAVSPAEPQWRAISPEGSAQGFKPGPTSRSNPLRAK